MAYQLYTLANIEDVPAKIVDFVTNNMTGWSAATGGAGPNGETTCTVDVPGTPAHTMQVLAKDGTAKTDIYCDNYVRIRENSGTPVNDARTYAPCYPTGPNEPDVAPRTADKLFLFGHPAPSGSEATGLAGVISFGTNRYRHFYIGRLDKRGTWTDGLVFDASNHNEWKNYYHGPDTWDNDYHKYLFRGIWTGDQYSGIITGDHVGGVIIDSPDDPETFRRFWCSNLSSYGNYLSGLGIGKEVFGGPLDGPLSGLFMAGFAPGGDSNIVLPIELYSNQDTGSSDRMYRPLGSVVGAFMVNMKNLAPEQEITVGSRTFMVFPAARVDLSSDVNTFGSGNDYWPEEDNSGPIGYAYEK